jgi:prepilin-type N-terminal cleavage/methylation domain-containing protein
MRHYIKTARSLRKANRGFTLLELIVAIGLIGVVLTGVYKVASKSIELSDNVLIRQHENMHMHSFMGLLKRNIEDIPGNAQINMEPAQMQSGVARSEIALVDYPLAFSWAGVSAGSKIVFIVTGPDKSLQGASQIEIRYLNQEEAEVYEERQSLSDDLGMGIVLMNGLKNVTWNFYDQRNKEWVDNWSVEEYPNQRPSMVYMEISFLDDSEPIQSYYWIPTVEDPASIARATQSGNSGANRASSGRGSNDRRGVVRPDGSRSRGDQGRNESRGRTSGGRGPSRPPTSANGRSPSSSAGIPGGSGQKRK